jgi:hypothetical protein
MKTDTQQLIIIGIVIISVGLIYKNQFSIVEGLGIGLIGFLSQRTQTEKQEEEYQKIMESELE